MWVSRVLVSVNSFLIAIILAWPSLPLRAQALVTELGDLGGGEGQARAVNDAGQVVGWSRTASGELRAFLWEEGVMSDLGIPDSVGRDINQSGDVVGYYPILGHDHGFLWQRGQLTDLGAGRAATGTRDRVRGWGKIQPHHHSD